MKVTAIVRLGDDEHSFVIPCGTGDKTFKWLGNAISQRFAMSAPNGALRSRESFHAISERVQFLTTNIMVPSGDIPNPAQLLHDFLHDGDTVVVDMNNKMEVRKVTGAPRNSSWSTLAYSVSPEHLHVDEATEEDEEGEESDEEGGDNDEQNEHIPASELQAKKAARINFMKVVLKSQLIDEKEVIKQVMQVWDTLGSKLRLLSPDDQKAFQDILIAHWDIFLDIFAAYQAPDSEETLIDLERLTLVMEDAAVFPAIHILTQSSLIYTHALAYFPKYTHQKGLPLEGFLLALILAAQLKYNDSLESKLRSPLTEKQTRRMTPSSSTSTLQPSPSRKALTIVENSLGKFTWSGVEDFKRLIEDFMLPLARDLGCHSHLRSVFLSDQCLLKIRERYETLQQLFDRESIKTRDYPTTISAEVMSELLYNSGLAQTTGTTADVDKCRLLLEEVRHGTIYGRQSDMRREDARFQYPEEDFTFAEFVEAVARAGYYGLKDAPQTKKTDEEERELTVVDFMLKGITNVSDFATGKFKKAPAQTATAKGRGGRTTAGAR